MSKDKQKVPTGIYGYAWLVHDHQYKYIEGKVLTLVETLGLPQKQEEAIKGLIRQVIYEDMGLPIAPSLNEAIKEASIKDTRMNTPRKDIELADIIK